MTKTEIIKVLMNEYLDCVLRSASPDDPSRDDEYLEGLLDGRGRGVLYAMALLKKLEEKPEPMSFEQLYLANGNWTSNSLLTLTLGLSKSEKMTAMTAMKRYGTAKVGSFQENYVHLLMEPDNEETEKDELW